MFKFFTIEHLLTEENRKIVFPLLFDLYYLPHAKANSYFVPVDALQNADVAIIPVDINYFFKTNSKKILFDFIRNAHGLHIPVWVYSAGDFGITLNENVITFRLGGFDSKLDSRTHILPSFVNDPYSDLLTHDWQPVPKTILPTVGFVGHANGSLLKWIKELLLYSKQLLEKIIKKDFTDKQSFFPSSRIRYKLLKKLERNTSIVTGFIFRDKYRAGAVTDLDRKESTQAFYENIEKNLYTFCLRGSGNFSVRFYETLLMGRIPLLINTDCRLPLDEVVNWSQHCIIANKDHYIEQLIAFHASKSADEILEIQSANRKLALEKLNRVDYFIQLSDFLLSK